MDARKAKDAFQDKYGLLLENVVYNFSVAVIWRTNEQCTFSVRCWFDDPAAVSKKRKEAILYLLGDAFDFDGTSYSLSIAFTRVPISIAE